MAATQDQLNAFNAAVQSGDYTNAYNMATAAGYNAGDIANYVNSNPSTFSGSTTTAAQVAQLGAPAPAMPAFPAIDPGTATSVQMPTFDNSFSVAAQPGPAPTAPTSYVAPDHVNFPAGASGLITSGVPSGPAIDYSNIYATPVLGRDTYEGTPWYAPQNITGTDPSKMFLPDGRGGNLGGLSREQAIAAAQAARDASDRALIAVRPQAADYATFDQYLSATKDWQSQVNAGRSAAYTDLGLYDENLTVGHAPEVDEYYLRSLRDGYMTTHGDNFYQSTFDRAVREPQMAALGAPTDSQISDIRLAAEAANSGYGFRNPTTGVVNTNGFYQNGAVNPNYAMPNGQTYQQMYGGRSGTTTPQTGGTGVGQGLPTQGAIGAQPGLISNGNTQSSQSGYSYNYNPGQPHITNVDPAMETVEQRIASLVNPENPINQRIATAIRERANARGLLNSSMADQATQAAIIDNAQGIANADAQTYSQTRFRNQDALNEFSRAAQAHGFNMQALDKNFGNDLTKMGVQHGFNMDVLGQNFANDLTKMDKQFSVWQQQLGETRANELQNNYMNGVSAAQSQFSRMFADIQNSSMDEGQKTAALQQAQILRDNTLSMYNSLFKNMPKWSSSYQLLAPTYQ